jgi:hypothetical protein
MEVPMSKGFLFFVSTLALIAACTTSKSPASPSGASASSGGAAHAGHGDVSSGNPNSAAHDDKGYIDGWIDGEDVQLYYTKSYFCPPLTDPAPPAPCEVGGAADDAPHPGAIRTIYAIAPAPAIAPLVDPATLACRAGTACLNHPAMIDLSRLGLSPTAPAAAHNHIINEQGGGWFNTVNIRVFSLAAWNQIAAAKSLDMVRQLQGNPATGTPNVISGDTPTNIFFFIASSRKGSE